MGWSRFRAPVGPGRGTDALAHSVDLYATVLDIVHAPLPPSSSAYDGVSLVPVIQATGAARARVFTEVFKPFGQLDVDQQKNVGRALFDGRWRYVFLSQLGGNPNRPPPMPAARSEGLYDDLNDPLETTNVIDAHPDLKAQFRREMNELLAS